MEQLFELDKFFNGNQLIVMKHLFLSAFYSLFNQMIKVLNFEIESE